MSDEHPTDSNDIGGTESPIDVSLEPSTSEGRREAEHAVGVRNRTRTPISARISASDEQGFLAFDAEPEVLDVGGGGASSSRLTVRTRKRLVLRGRKLRPFRVSISVGGTHLEVDGAMLQRRFVPWWGVPPLLLLGLVACVVVIVIVILIVFAFRAIL